MNIDSQRSVHTILTLPLAWLIAPVLSATAQGYPTKQIKLVVPFSAGSVQDLRGTMLHA